MAETKQCFERGASHSTFDIADHLLRNPGLLRERIHGQLLLFTLGFERFREGDTERFDNGFFEHNPDVGKIGLDRASNYRESVRLMNIIRRIGPDPHANGAQTSSLRGCPDILELENGDFAIIGVDITEATIDKLKFGAGCGPDERIIRIPRKTLMLAKSDIPETI